MTLEELEALIDERILTGGRRTRADALREVLKEIARSSPNIEDGVSEQIWITEDERVVRVTIDGTNQFKITDI